MKPLTPKALRSLNFEVARLFNHKSFKAVTPPAELTGIDRRREIEVGDHTFLWTDSGFEVLLRVMDRLTELDVCDGEANDVDLWSATLDFIKQCLSQGQQPESGTEFLSQIRAAIHEQIATHRFVVLLDGVELAGIDSCALGRYQIVSPTAAWLTQLGGDGTTDTASQFLQVSGLRLWLTAEARGTLNVARARFEAGARLVTGLLAVATAANYPNGAHHFRISVAMAIEHANGTAHYLHWTDRDRYPVLTLPGRHAQPLKIDAAFSARLQSEWSHAVRVLESATPTPLEDALQRAVYWFGEAHRETLMEMRLLKYWSCVETFFSRSPTGITNAVTAGLAATLTGGAQPSLPLADYSTLKARLKKLYDKRSKATHEAQSGHVTELDAADLSQWIAWMLINLLSLSVDGVADLDELARWATAHDARHDPPTPTSATSAASHAPAVKNPIAAVALPSLKRRLQRAWRAGVEVFRSTKDA